MAGSDFDLERMKIARRPDDADRGLIEAATPHACFGWRGDGNRPRAGQVRRIAARRR